KSVGLCPQTNNHFEQLTVEEHLYFFGLIKGYNLSNIGPEIDRVLKLLNIEDKRYFKPSEISGGMQRKLQLGITFIGGSKILILDEPSSGLDVETRRTVWDLLLSIRDQHAILITTHHMEEADALGDRIAIMSQGEVKCSGSPIFLKRVFGVGYFIRVAKTNTFDKANCEQAIRNHLKSAKLQKDSTNEILFSFKKDETAKLPGLFDELQDSERKQRLGIASVGISVTSMDDVFLRVGMLFDKKNSDVKSKPSLSQLLVSDRTPKSAFGGLLLKRFHNIKRQPFTILFFIGLIA
ncbi:ATP-binding cassette sub-family A member 1-like protein, partial [Leptotrombidium deliense]